MNGEALPTVTTLAQRVPPGAVRAAFIKHWLAANPEAAVHLPPHGYAARMIDSEDRASLREAARAINNINTSFTLKSLESVFETYIDYSRKKKQGVVYTPEHIIDYLVLEGLKTSRKGKASHILDPACGSGGFLLRAAMQMEQHFGLSPEQAFLENLSGIDNDPIAIDHARCLIELYMTQKGVTFDASKAILVCGDTLLDDARLLLEAVRSADGVQLVATNPPYVKLQTLDMACRRALSQRYPDYTKYNFSLAILFLVTALDLISDDGTVAFITQNNLFTSLSGEAVRRALQTRRAVRRIVDFGHYRVFSGVLAYTCLIFLDKRQHENIKFARIERETTIEELSDYSFDDVSVNSLKPDKWRLAKRSHQVNLRKIEQCGRPLSECVDIKVGFATLKDKVFWTNNCKDGLCISKHPSTGKEYEVEEGVTMQALRIADVGPDVDLDAVTRRIIFPYRRVGTKFILIPEDELASSFPKAYRYLSECRALLEPRDKGKRRYKAWYAWGRTQGREAPGPKLLTKTFSKTPQFFFDQTDRLFCNGYGLFPLKEMLFSSSIGLQTLKAILESRVMHYYSKLTSFQIDGNFQCYQKNFIEMFGIPVLSQDDKESMLNFADNEREAFIANRYDIPESDISEIIGSNHCPAMSDCHVARHRR